MSTQKTKTKLDALMSIIALGLGPACPTLGSGLVVWIEKKANFNIILWERVKRRQRILISHEVVSFYLYLTMGRVKHITAFW